MFLKGMFLGSKCLLTRYLETKGIGIFWVKSSTSGVTMFWCFDSSQAVRPLRQWVKNDEINGAVWFS